MNYLRINRGLLLTIMTTSIPAIITAPATWAEDNIEQQKEIEVIGITPTHGVGLPAEMIPFNVQSATSKDLERSQSFDLTDFMNRNLGSVHINAAQNNPLQPDVQFRGFTASPLLGLPQGLAIYHNGVRINEPFGDTINWDLLPESAIASINLIGGANPIFGLNTLGGALSITTKNGFSHQGHSVEAYGGSFERVVTTIESGANNGVFGYYFTGDYFQEDGWRVASDSDALNLFGSLSWRSMSSTLDLGISHGDTELRGNGPTPVELLAMDRSAAFTVPDITENNMTMVNLEGTHWLMDTIQMAGNVFYRINDTDSFNGDGTEFAECKFSPADLNGKFLVDGIDEDDLPAACGAGTATEAAINALGGEIVEDQFGNNIDAENVNGSERDAINNISNREQEGFGASFQTTFLNDLFNHDNQLIAGAGYQQGLIDFIQVTEIASLACTFSGVTCVTADADRSTTNTGIFAVGEGTSIKARNTTWSLFLSDTFSVTDQLDLTISARYNNSSIVLSDASAGSDLVDPEDPDALNGEHDYDRINPAVGLTYAINHRHGIYGSYSESSRAPTPIELLCADPDAPCSLPNAFLADPPLDQVVTESWEGGLRGTFNDDITYNIGAFHSTNNNDIIFTSTGGIGSNEGFFSNVGNTRRVGAELGLTGTWKRLDWFVNYGYVEATFRDGFQAASANHPRADGNGEISVEEGDRIPGIPEHTLKLGGEFSVTSRFSIGANLIYNSDQYLRGDEGNLLDTVDDYALVNVHGEYKIGKYLTAFAKINNLFDSDYETFGLLGEPAEVFPTFTDNRFLGQGLPISGFVGVRAVF